jgi:GTP-binding protein Era
MPRRAPDTRAKPGRPPERKGKPARVGKPAPKKRPRKAREALPDSDRPSPPVAAAVPDGPTRCGFVAIIGATNAGKSTLVNALVGAKVSIVSHKVQTTRMPIRGIVIAGKAQIVLVDTPGIFAPRRRLDRAMVESAWSGASDGDISVLVVDAQKGLANDVEAIVTRLADTKGRKLLALNKIDRVAKPALLELARALNDRLPFTDTFMISALDGGGVDDLKKYLEGLVPEGPWHYPEDEISDLPQRVLAAEITREAIYRNLHQELPYATTVETTDWQDMRNGDVRLEQTIFVERQSQRSIILGAKGQTIKTISMQARQQLGALLERKVHLFLFVKVRDNWGDDPERYSALGLDFPKD